MLFLSLTISTEDIFAGFALGKQALDEIATFIQNYLAGIGSIQINSSSTRNVRSFSNSTNTVVKIDVLGDGQHIIATKTCSSETDTERFTFYMTYTVVQADINYLMMQQNQEKLDKVFNAITPRQSRQAPKELAGILEGAWYFRGSCERSLLSHKSLSSLNASRGFVSILLSEVAGDQLTDESSLYRNANENK
ncbi:hypothetical protein N7449_002123 [Penicillium cf. viridicatum]|uniref:Uncharacterized protein n=1 Tax=Penicillium cf. viridicatum TaxID=2972119 RepID=A0A9W9MUS8_9EURO|nr:hypothetical protein N7449_002123 [Penicillium cf. viridicatum]